MDGQPFQNDLAAILDFHSVYGIEIICPIDIRISGGWQNLMYIHLIITNYNTYLEA